MPDVILGQLGVANKIGSDSASDAASARTAAAAVQRAWVGFDKFGGGPDKTAAQNSAAWEAARIAKPATIMFWEGDFQFQSELIVDWPVSLVTLAAGNYHRFTATGYAPETRLLWAGDGDFYRTVKTRRRYRASESDPADDELSAGINIQFPGVKISPGIVVEVTGTNWDVGVFVGCRTDASVGCGVRGYCLKANVLVDGTRGSGIPELVGWDGKQYPAVGDFGADGFRMEYPAISGGLWGLVIHGPQPKPGLISYGSDYTAQLSTTFAAVPSEGATLRLGDITWTWRASPAAAFDLEIPATAAQAAETLFAAIMDLIDNTDDVSSAYPLFWTANYQKDDAVILAFRRELTTAFQTTFTAAVTGTGMTLSGTTPTVGADPGLYWNGTAAVTDNRGRFGMSDIYVGPGAIYAGNYANFRRRADIRIPADQALEGWSGGAVWVDGLAGNSARVIQGQTFFRTRFDSFEPFCVRLGACNATSLIDCMIDRFGNRAYLDTAGNPLSATHSTNAAAYYGPVAKGARTMRFLWIGRRNAFYSAHFDPYAGATRLIGSRSGDDYGAITRLLTLQVGQDVLGSETSTVRIVSGNSSGYAGVTFGDRDTAFRASIRHSMPAGKVSIRTGGISGTSPIEVVGFSQISSVPVVDTASVNGMSLRCTSSASTAEIDIRAGTAGLVRCRVGSSTRMQITASEIIASSTVRSNVDNTNDLGTPSSRWRVIYSNTGTINTSDEREKSQIGAVPDEWLDAWGEVEWCRYKFAGRTRWHIGLIAQRVEAAFAARGLDAREIGLLCWDAWPDQLEPEMEEVEEPVYGDDGSILRVETSERPTGRMRVSVPAGDRYGLRYEECLAMEAAWMRREMARMKGKADD
jgi:hypothetical protein